MVTSKLYFFHTPLRAVVYMFCFIGCLPLCSLGWHIVTVTYNIGQREPLFLTTDAHVLSRARERASVVSARRWLRALIHLLQNKEGLLRGCFIKREREKKTFSRHFILVAYFPMRACDLWLSRRLHNTDRNYVTICCGVIQQSVWIALQK